MRLHGTHSPGGLRNLADFGPIYHGDEDEPLRNMNASLATEWLKLLRDFGHAGSSLPRWLSLPHQAAGKTAVGTDLFGVNVASSQDPRCDDYVVAQLRNADINHVRLSWDMDSQHSHGKRFLQRLLDEKFAVMVSLRPTLADAKRLDTEPSAAAAWRQFLAGFFQAYGHRVSLCEIGNTPNRPRWSGYTPIGYVKAWQIAAEEAAKHKTSLAGPNISDFEPAFNTGYLRAMQRFGTSLQVHTTNLFVERGKEPERYDPSAFGKLLAGPLQLNLAKKINILKDISRSHGVARTYCTYTCWTHKRLSRWSVFPEAKGADYLARYLVICAASGGLDRIYWGPLIDRRDGLIDCGNNEYPAIDNVTHYQSVRGQVDDFMPRPVFFAYKFITTLLKGTYCQQGVGNRAGVNHYIFSDDSFDHHIVWATDGYRFELHSLYNQQPDSTLIRDIYGKEVVDDHLRTYISESPLVLSWPRSSDMGYPGTPYPSTLYPGKRAIQDCAPIGPAGTLHVPQTAWQTNTIDDGHWQGVAKLPAKSEPAAAAALFPSRIISYPVRKNLRDNRNKLWTIDNPTGRGMLVVKQNRARGGKRFSYLFRASKGKRHWNTATRMLRLGVATPQPIAYAEQKQFAGTFAGTFTGIRDNYYVAEYLPDAFSARDLFTSFAMGDNSYRGISKQRWLTEVAQYVCYMHLRRIIHRDLSSGNLLITMQDGKPQVYAIDIGRAVVDVTPAPLVDLKRICYKLSWPDRAYFVQQYRDIYPHKSLRYWRISLYGYELKQAAKKGTKRRIKGLLSGLGKSRKRASK